MWVVVTQIAPGHFDGSNETTTIVPSTIKVKAQNELRLVPLDSTAVRFATRPIDQVHLR